MTTLINRARRSRRTLATAIATLFGVALLGMMAGAAQARPEANSAQAGASATRASTTLPLSEVHITANKGPLLSLEAGPSSNGHAAVFETFENPTQPTPEDMKFFAYPYDGNKTFILCSKPVSESLGFLGLACLDITGKSLASGATVKIAPFDNTKSQQWVIENKDPVRPQTLTLRNVHSGLYLDSGATPESGDRPRQRPFQQGASQQWFIKPTRQ